MTGNTVVRRLALLLLGLLVVGAWWNSLDAPFVYDDKLEAIGNPTIRMLENWRAIAGYNVSRPLLQFTYAWNHDAFGRDPTGWHAVNIAVHVLSVWAALWMAEAVGRLGGHPHPQTVAILVAGVWGLHPMVTEAVSYTTGRSESLCALFCFLALAAWATALQRERTALSRVAPGPGAAWAAGAPWRLLGMLAFCGAVTSKEVGAMVPAAVLALELLLGRGRDGGGLSARLRGPRWAWYLPFAGLVVLAAWLRLQHAGSLLPREVDRGLAVQLTTQAEVWLRYVGLWIAPTGQTIFHHIPDLDPGTARGAGAIAGWLALVGLGGWWSRGRPLAAFALLAGALFLIPSSSVVPLKESMAEHRAYQTGLFLALAVGWSVPAAWRVAAARVAGVLVIVGMLGTIQRNKVWQSEVALWAEATRESGDSADAWYGLGDALRFDGRMEQASHAYRKAIALDPGHLDARNNLGISLATLGDHDGAVAAWRGALEQRPTYCKAHNNLGFLAMQQQDWDLALAELRSTLAYCPDDVLAHYGLGTIYADQGVHRDRAVMHLQRVLDLDPAFSRAPEVRERLLQLTW